MNYQIQLTIRSNRSHCLWSWSTDCPAFPCGLCINRIQKSTIKFSKVVLRKKGLLNNHDKNEWDLNPEKEKYLLNDGCAKKEYYIVYNKYKSKRFVDNYNKKQ